MVASITNIEGAAGRPLPIFRSRAQERLLRYLFVRGGDGRAPLSALSERTGIPRSTLHREVDLLERSGIVVSERIGNTRLVAANRDSPYFEDLRSLLVKAFGPVSVLADVLRGVPRIREVAVFGSWARRSGGEPGPPPADIDVLVVGHPDLNAVYKAARAAERELNLEVNPVVITPEEWEQPSGLARRIKRDRVVRVPLGA